MKDEGDLLVIADGRRFVLECHESGPEILLYLGLATAALNLAKPIVDLLTTFVKSLQEERKGPRLKLTRRRVVRGTVEEELLVEIDLPVSRETTKMIEAQVAKALQRDVERGPTDAGLGE
jgi:hypothetical protein